MENECKGCTVYEDQICAIRLNPRISETLQCPCMNCLVKIMCIGVCQEFNTYVKISGKEKERIRNDARRNEVYRT